MNSNSKKYNEVLEIIDRRLIPDKAAKNARGEVFTPLNLVREMILGISKSSIDSGKIEIWGIKDNTFIDDDESDRIGGIPLEILRDSESTFLDPSNGIGNFPIVTFYILDYQLNKHGKTKEFRGEENTKKRQKHIVTNMLYMIELNKGNVNTSIKIFKLITNATPNICCANTIIMTDEKLMSYFGINRFDVIMGNPPYNKGGIRSKVGSKEGIETIWPQFIYLSIKLLKDNGFLIFITPNTWIELKANISKEILEYQLNYLRSYNVVESHALFSGQSGEIPLAYFQLEKKHTKKDTYIFDKSLKKFIAFNIYDNRFIPSDGIQIISKLLDVKKKHGSLNNYYENTQTKKTQPKKTQTKKNTKIETLISDTFSNEYIYPLINIANNKINISYTNKCFNNHNNIPKLVFPNFSMGYPLLDITGILEPAANMMFVVNQTMSNLKKIQELFYTNIVFFIINSLKTKQKFMSNRIFELLPDITKITSFPLKINDESLYDFFDFDKVDIECIENYKKSGEGRLTNETTKKFLQFNIEDYIPKTNINKIQSAIKKCKSNTKNKGSGLNKTRKLK